jgi:hypothetical protein
MLAARTILRVGFLVLVIGLIGSTPTYPQSAAFFSTSRMSSNRIGSGAWLAKCEASSVNSLAAWRHTDKIESPPTVEGVAGDSNITGPHEGVCLDATFSAPARALPDNLCLPNVTRNSGAPHAFPCAEPDDIVPGELSALGKAGLKIARARKEVLEILRSQNACTAWFEAKEAIPAATFQSLRFALDLHGPEDIFESMNRESLVVRRQPYVARAIQDGGAHTTITINANGAFYRPQGNVLKILPEGGPVYTDGTRLLTVGSYRGDTLPAQVTTLLHEFGHIIDLLPEDADNLDGKSVQNTDEVLRHCRAEVEARAQQTKQTAKRQFVGSPWASR